MKIYLDYIVLFGLVFLSSFIQSQSLYEKGYIVTSENDTLQGKIKDRKPYPFPKIYKKIRFKRENSIFPKFLSPSKITAYKISDRTYTSIGIERKNSSFSNKYYLNPKTNKIFLRLVHKGSLSYYWWEVLDYESDVIDNIPLFHLENKDYMVRATQGLLGLKIKLLTVYFSECQILSQKIKNREIKSPEKLIEAYEMYCR